MSFTFNKIVEGNFQEVKERVIEALKAEKFGVITHINVQATIKEKLDKDMMPYEILGACSPGHAYKAVHADDEIGAFLPCNVTLSEKVAGQIKVSIVNPLAMMEMIDNKEVKEMATEVSLALKRVHDSL